MPQDDSAGITQISRQLAKKMPSPGVEETEVAQAVRATLYYAEDAGILPAVTKTIEEQAAGDETVAELCEALRRR
jgi:hypothetical protein